jgi:hypothetical protein
MLANIYLSALNPFSPHPDITPGHGDRGIMFFPALARKRRKPGDLLDPEHISIDICHSSGTAPLSGVANF